MEGTEQPHHNDFVYDLKDEEGYLVTREEPSWESFSEDEPAAPPSKKKPAVNVPKGKPGAKPGQGNIMSFFGKK